MAKRASNYRNSLYSTNSSPVPTPSKKMVLRIKSAQNSKRVERDEEEDVREGRPSLVKRSKSTLMRKKKIDANKPKKPPTAFFYFLEDFRKGYQEENPQVKSMRDIGKACGEKWKTMTYEGV